MKFLSYILLIGSTCALSLAANAQYKGGSYDGFDAIGIVQLTNTNVAYMGGTADGFAIASTDPALPIMFANFIATYFRQSNAVQLQWQTATESNTGYFKVQHSLDGTTGWTTLQSVTAAGNSTDLKTYTTLHNGPVNGRNYYRIITVDKDGKTNTSKTQLINLAGSKQFFTVANNPVGNTLQLQINTSLAGNYNISVVTATGQQLSSINQALAVGISSLAIDVSANTAGIYFVTISNAEQKVKQTIRVVKE